MLDHPNIDVLLNTDHRDVVGQIGSARTVFTGPIDEYFDQSYGALPTGASSSVTRRCRSSTPSPWL
jgi:UDP-galactopyranose mutase